MSDLTFLWDSSFYLNSFLFCDCTEPLTAKFKQISFFFFIVLEIDILLSSINILVSDYFISFSVYRSLTIKNIFIKIRLIINYST